MTRSGSRLIAALPMYDWPEVRSSNDAVWHAVSNRLLRAGIAAPAHLTRTDDLHGIWTNDALLLAQTCGYPMMTDLTGHVRMVATPHYAVKGCRGAYYSSVLLARREDRGRTLASFRRRTAAYNSSRSQSGYSAFRHIVAPLSGDGRFFARTVETGSHRNSMHAVAQGKADLCAVDAVCWAMEQRHDKQTADRLAEIAWTPHMPGLPLVTSRASDDRLCQTLFDLIEDALGDPSLSDACRALFITGIELLDADRYRAITDCENEARQRGYPDLG